MAPYLSKLKKGLIVTAAILNVKKSIKKKKVWVKDWLLKREKFSHVVLLRELEADDFKNYLRMDSDCFNELLGMVAPYIAKQDTVMRESISPQERLVATLRFLATGREYEDLKYSAVISPQLLSTMIPETCEAIITVLKDYIKVGK